MTAHSSHIHEALYAEEGSQARGKQQGLWEERPVMRSQPHWKGCFLFFSDQRQVHEGELSAL